MTSLTIDLPSHVPADEARLLLSIKLYEATDPSIRFNHFRGELENRALCKQTVFDDAFRIGKRISLGKAAEMAGY